MVDSSLSYKHSSTLLLRPWMSSVAPPPSYNCRKHISVIERAAEGKRSICCPKSSQGIPHNPALFPGRLPSAVASRVAPMASSTSTAQGTIDNTAADVSSLAIILEPLQAAGVDVLFFFMPGALTASKEYLPLLKEVQAKCSLRLWVAILDPGSVPWVSTAMVEASFDGVLARVRQLGFPAGPYPSKGVVVGGHSWGAWESRSIALKRAEAFIQLGSCFHSNPDNLIQYPKPVLTMCGALDAQITNASTVKHAGDVFAMKDELGDFFVHGVKPVILVPGMNHAQFSHGIPNKERGDFDAEISIEQARDVSSSLISSFITLHMCGQDEDTIASALAVLREAVCETHQRYKVFWEAMQQPGKGAKKVQLDMAAIPALKESQIGVVQHEYKDNFIYSKPSIDTLAGRIIINTYLSPLGKYNLLSNIWVKCKSREAVIAAFGSDKMDEEPLSIGSYINEKTFTQALAEVPEAVRQKFEQRGKKLRFLEDMVIKSSAQEWIDSDLIIKPAEDGTEYVDVQSTALIAPLKGMPARFAGMHYLKLLTAARAFSWIYEDAFR